MVDFVVDLYYKNALVLEAERKLFCKGLKMETMGK
jgi:hypothetical protein